ncbi:hypothetical protein C8F01DRAFT_1246428 [Mycena amicta]|nr:hypothetical protein C8F01DRAFT_1246428 [Mycena amicta]
MTTPPPTQRTRIKTSDISDFFRASGSKARSADTLPESGPSSPTFLSEPDSSPVRKRSTRIPFLGRQRKKSTHSDASTSSTSPSTRQSDSEVRNSDASRLTEPRPDVPPIPDAGRTRQSSPSKVPLPSLGSKIVAHFAPSRQKLLPQKRTQSTTDDFSSRALFPPVSPSRGTSIDSTENRSVTPRPNQPTITVSVPPDSFEDYKDMFTLPKVDDGQRTPTIDSVRFPTPLTSPDSQVEPSSTMKRRISRSTTDGRTSRTARKSVGHTSRQEIDSEDSEAVMSDTPKASPPMLTPTAEKRRTLATTMPYRYTEKSSKSIMKSPLDRPPAFPPPPPPSNPPSSALPVIPSPLSRKPDSPTLGTSRRQRAQTLSAVPAQSALSNTLPLRRSPPYPSENKKLPEVPTAKEKENFDVETASPDQLRQELKLRTLQLEELRKALLLRNQQFDELASYLLTATDSHGAEKRSLQKRIDGLELEATRRDKELQGLRWLVTNNTQTRPDLGSLGDAVSKRTRALDLNPASEDSGTESHRTTSGAEDSYKESGTSGAESFSSAGRKVKRSTTRSSRPEANFSPLLPYSSNTSSATRSTSSFGTTSSSSSTSSLSLMTATSATTVTSLGAIPETSPPPSPSPATTALRIQDPVVAAAIMAAENQRTKDERRATRAANRISASSANSVASVAYTSNLKRGRPPSIAQVLASSPRMENGVAPTSRAYASGSLSS